MFQFKVEIDYFGQAFFSVCYRLVTLKYGSFLVLKIFDFLCEYLRHSMQVEHFYMVQEGDAMLGWDTTTMTLLGPEGLKLSKWG